MGISSVGSLRLVCVSGSLSALPTISGMTNAKGLESQPPGSAGRLSLPATAKLLKIPSASFGTTQCSIAPNDGSLSGGISGNSLPDVTMMDQKSLAYPSRLCHTCGWQETTCQHKTITVTPRAPRK